MHVTPPQAPRVLEATSGTRKRVILKERYEEGVLKDDLEYLEEE